KNLTVSKPKEIEMKKGFNAAYLSMITMAAIAPVAVLAATEGAYPSKPITMVVPFPPGGTADGFVRPLAQELSKRIGQPVVVENKPGANGNIGSSAVARAPADGYTILYSSLSTLAVNPFIYP